MDSVRGVAALVHPWGTPVGDGWGERGEGEEEMKWEQQREGRPKRNSGPGRPKRNSGPGVLVFLLDSSHGCHVILLSAHHVRGCWGVGLKRRVVIMAVLVRTVRLL